MPPETDVDADTSGIEQSTSASPDGDDGVDRRRLIRWIAVLAFAVPVVVELLTFGNLLGDELLSEGSSDDTSGATTDEQSGTETSVVGEGDELLPETDASETVVTSEVRGDPSSDQTYVLRVNIENSTDSPVELKLTALRLRDGTTLDSVSASGTIPPGEEGEVTGAWSLPNQSMPAAVEAAGEKDGETVVSRFVPLKRPAIRG